MARLEDIIEALELQIEEYSSFLDLENGEVQTVSDRLLGAADDGEKPEFDEWEKDEWDVAKRIISTPDRFLALPSKFDVHEWEIMQDFAASVTSARIREDLLDAIHGGGAFRRFKNGVRYHGVEKKWFEFRSQALRQIAIDWCEENKISWTE